MPEAYGEIIAVCSDIHSHRNILCGQNAEFLHVKHGGKMYLQEVGRGCMDWIELARIGADGGHL